MRIITYDKKQKERFNNLVKERYGFEVKGQIIRQGSEKVRIFTGNLSEHELNVISGTVRVETVGLYLATKDETFENIRFSFDASFLGKDAVKNVLDLDDIQVRQWFQGNDILLDDTPSEQSPEFKNQALTSSYPFIFLRYKEEIVGVGKLTDDKTKLINFVPKERRIKY